MIDWWQSPLGQYVLQKEQAALSGLQSHFFGYHQIQVGGGIKIMPEFSRPVCQSLIDNSADIIGRAEILPLRSQSIDNLLLVHVLEFSEDPHQILREAERVLVDGGSLILCCFNPVSLWGLRRLFSLQDMMPWQGHFFTQTRIKDWLALLNLEMTKVEHHIFRLPINSHRWLNRCAYVERWGKRMWPFLGGVTLLVATKRSIPLTPITNPWQKKQLFPGSSLANKPITRDKMDG